MPPSQSQSVPGSGAAAVRPHIAVIIPALNEEETTIYPTPSRQCRIGSVTNSLGVLLGDIALHDF